MEQFTADKGTRFASDKFNVIITRDGQTLTVPDDDLLQCAAEILRLRRLELLKLAAWQDIVREPLH